ncbi:MAG: DMT family transporter [Planctomycetota bacterium]
MSPAMRLLAAGVLFSLGGALIKASAFPALQSAGLRSLVAGVTLFALLPEARRWPRGRMLWLLLPYFGATCLFVVANTLTTAANAIFLQSTAPFWVTVLAPLLLKETTRRRDLLVLLCIAAGMTMFFVAPQAASSTARDPRLGDWIALASGLSYALLLLGFRALGRSGGDSGGAATVVAWGNVLTVPITWAIAPAFGQDWIAGDAQSWLVMAVLGTLQVGLAYALVVRAMPHVPALQASLILMIEPALNPVLAFLAHGERPHALALGGGALIVGAVVLGSLRRRARAAPPAAAAPPFPRAAGSGTEE